ncbi:hydrogenase expression/formation protein HypD [Candidatus Kryptonium thompsonii]|nr:hydrogenase expression/formation protein HypD [Candidatus Kryptonium thompsoni]
MKFIDEYRDSKLVKAYVEKIHEITTREWTIMEICGGQTHTIIKYGIDEMLPDKINIVHGPGCPVCVTPLEIIDKAIEIASTPGVIFCSFGDMLRVPGSKKDLFTVKSEGGDVRIVYSPLDAVKIAMKNPDKKVVFFAIGFETTAPANAMAVWRAKELGLKNFFALVSHVRVPPAIITILESPWNMINGFIAAGHVCTVMGYEEYEPIAEKYKVPIVVTGFEPVDILQGIFMLIKQLEEGRHEVENQYKRSVRREGNIPAKQLIFKVFEIADMKWRGIGLIPNSGFKLKEEFSEFDAEKVF